MNKNVMDYHYQKYYGSDYRLFISRDGNIWESAEPGCISAVGLKFETARKLQEGSELFINVQMYNLLSEFNMSFKVVIQSCGKSVRSNNVYVAAFKGADKYQQIQLDEVIKSKLSCGRKNQPAYDDDFYSFVFRP